MKIKMERINSELAKQIAKIISEDIKDPRLGDALIGVTKVYTTPDLKYAKAYLSIYAPNADAVKEAYMTVCRSKAFIRARLKESVKMRLIPEITYYIDDSVDYGNKIDEILAQIKAPVEEA